MLLAQGEVGSGGTLVTRRPGRSIAQVPQELRGALKDRSDPTGQALIAPRRFTQAAELLTGRGARVDDGEDDYLQERAKHLRPAIQFGYNPELLASSRIRSLVELDAAFDRWRTLPSPKWQQKVVNELVALRKLEFASSAARQDSAADMMALLLREDPRFDEYHGGGYERTVTVWRKDGNPDQSTLVPLSNPGNEHRLKSYWEAWNNGNAAEMRVHDLSSLLRDQIKSGRVDQVALIREAPVVRPVLRMFGNP